MNGFPAFNGQRFSSKADANYRSFCWAASLAHLQDLTGKPPLRACALWWMLLRSRGVQEVR
jgi:hypothetical protein